MNQWQRARIQNTTPTKIDIPVICIGNIVIGGAGKTPTALAIAEKLMKQGHNPHFISRGYGGKAKGPLQVDLSVHNSRSVGDEALLLARKCTTWVSKNRVSAGMLAMKNGADILILDDGFQNPKLYKDLSILAVENEFGLGNGRIIPAGPLRESPNDALKRASLLLKIFSFGKSDTEIKLFENLSIPTIRANVIPNIEDSQQLKGHDILAFSGIARPQKFFSTLDTIGCKIVEFKKFPDHYQFKDSEIISLIDKAKLLNAKLVTTEKDLVRIPDHLREKIKVLRISISFSNNNLLDDILMNLFLND